MKLSRSEMESEEEEEAEVFISWTLRWRKGDDLNMKWRSLERWTVFTKSSPRHSSENIRSASHGEIKDDRRSCDAKKNRACITSLCTLDAEVRLSSRVYLNKPAETFIMSPSHCCSYLFLNRNNIILFLWGIVQYLKQLRPQTLAWISRCSASKFEFLGTKRHGKPRHRLKSIN